MTPDDAFYLEERYMRRPRSRRLLPLFYRVKRFIPRRTQMRMRRTMARRQRVRHEGPKGLANVERLLEIERRHGVVSAWFFVAEDYAVDPAVLEAVRAAGCEVGLHGLHHNGRLFQSRAHFERQLPRIRRYLREWGAEGFRSPSTHRNAAWMPELGARYDSSFPDTHPFDAQPGGCCSILPYFLGDLVELPITLPQDHTLFELLQERDISLWRKKAGWIAR